jgi:molybdopterin converting factor small subunit
LAVKFPGLKLRKMKVQAYGRLTDIMDSAGFNPEGLENTDQLKKKLLFLYPDLSGIDYAIAVNDQIVRGNHPLRKDDDVSLLPPFSGG